MDGAGRACVTLLVASKTNASPQPATDGPFAGAGGQIALPHHSSHRAATHGGLPKRQESRKKAPGPRPPTGTWRLILGSGKFPKLAQSQLRVEPRRVSGVRLIRTPQLARPFRTTDRRAAQSSEPGEPRCEKVNSGSEPEGRRFAGPGDPRHEERHPDGCLFPSVQFSDSFGAPRDGRSTPSDGKQVAEFKATTSHPCRPGPSLLDKPSEKPYSVGVQL